MSVLIVPVNPRDHIRGNPKAPITVVEYSDFEHPNCREVYSILKALERDLKDKFKLVFRHFPFNQTQPYAYRAACSAEVSSFQGKFWEMHDLLFENQEFLEDEDLVMYAEILGLDVERFIKDLNSPAASNKVLNDFMGGMRSGVSTTPTLFINGIRFNGSFQYQSLLTAIELTTTKGRGNRKVTGAAQWH